MVPTPSAAGLTREVKEVFKELGVELDTPLTGLGEAEALCATLMAASLAGLEDRQLLQRLLSEPAQARLTSVFLGSLPAYLREAQARPETLGLALELLLNLCTVGALPWPAAAEAISPTLVLAAAAVAATDAEWCITVGMLGAYVQLAVPGTTNPGSLPASNEGGLQAAVAAELLTHLWAGTREEGHPGTQKVEREAIVAALLLLDKRAEAWGAELAGDTAQQRRWRRLRTACLQFLRNQGLPLDWAQPSDPSAQHAALMAECWACCATGRTLSAALAALCSSSWGLPAADAPPDSAAVARASVEGFWERVEELAVSSAILHALVDSVEAAPAPAAGSREGAPGAAIAAMATLPEEASMMALRAHASCLALSDNLFNRCMQPLAAAGDGGGGQAASARPPWVLSITSEPECEECVRLGESLLRLAGKWEIVSRLGGSLGTRHLLELVTFLLVPLTRWSEIKLPANGRSQLGSLQSTAASATKLLRMANRGSLELAPAAGESACSLLVHWMALVMVVLDQHPDIAEGTRQHNLTLFIRRTGLLTFGCLPVLVQAVGQRSIGKFALANKLLQPIYALGIMDEAVRGGIGQLLTLLFESLLRQQNIDGAVSLLRLCERVCSERRTASLALAVGGQGLLEAAVTACCQLIPHMPQSPRIQAAAVRRIGIERGGMLLATCALLYTLCEVLESQGMGNWVQENAALLDGLPSAAIYNEEQEAGSPDPRIASIYRARTWRALQLSLLPRLVAACRELLAGGIRPADASGGPTQDEVLRVLALSAATCANPRCINLRGPSEGGLQFKTCGRCGEARYCSVRCQRADWRAHRAVCATLREIKGG